MLQLAPHFHYVGRLAMPCGREPLLRDAIPFPWERLDGRPLLYASLGTLQNGRPELFAEIATACAPLNAQLVISLGNPASVPLQLPGNPLVVAYAPHQQLIERATLVISHAGLNTTLTALDCGAGRVLPVRQLRASTLQAMVEEMLHSPRYRAEALRLQAEGKAAGGVVRAADLIEQLSLAPPEQARRFASH